MLFEDRYFTTKIVEWEETNAPENARKHQSVMARRALEFCLKYLEFETNFASNLLEIENHHHLKYCEKYLVSLSHTHKIAVASLALQTHYASIGVDIEYCSRKINGNTQKYFLNPKDREDNLLKLWCQKEAIYKALDPVKNFRAEFLDIKSILFTDIWIKDNKFGLDSLSTPSMSLGEVNLHTLNSNQGQIYIALAGLKYHKEKI